MLRARWRLMIGLAPALGVLASGSGVEAQNWRTLTSMRQLHESGPLEARVTFGAGVLEILPARAGTLYHAEISHPEAAAEPRITFDPGSRRLRIDGAPERRRFGSRREGTLFRLGLSAEVPLDLDLEFGAGRSTMELGGMRLRRFSISTGASESVISFGSANRLEMERFHIEAGAASLEVTGLGHAAASRLEFQGGVGSTILDFSGVPTRDISASVQMGVGSVTIRIPRALGVRIQRSSFMTSFSAPGFERLDGEYRSTNWESAERKLSIELTAALGSVDIEWIEEAQAGGT